MKIEEIEGIGEVFGKKLEKAGVGTVDALLEKGAKRDARHQLAEKTGISERQLLHWVDRADLIRIKGIGSEYSDLLEECGVTSGTELSHKQPAQLHKKLEEVNSRKHLVRRVPSTPEIEAWIREARGSAQRIEQ
jgi:predicted flap endonuclease-1-like 5' DNA nuclease